jgi:UDP-glucose 4-epimerase
VTRVLVTGGSGFIGSAVVAELEGRGVKASTFDWRNGCDVRNAGGVLEAVEGNDAVIHLAGVLGTHELFDTPQLAVDVNVSGTLNVLEACRLHGAAYVGITMPPVFPSVYTATKVAATRLASAYHHTHGVPVSHVRAFNAFGPGQAHGPGHPQKIVPTFAVEAWAGRPIPIWGDGKQTVDLIHTRDLARMLVDALEHGGDVTFDGGTGTSMPVNAVARLVLGVTKSQAGIEYLPMRRGEVPTGVRATREGWQLLGWNPRLNYNDLDDTIESYRTHAMALAA